MVNATYDEIFGAALSLPPGLKAMLAEHLIESLDAAQQPHIDALWAEQAEKRIQAVDLNLIALIPGEQVFRELRNPNYWADRI